MRQRIVWYVCIGGITAWMLVSLAMLQIKANEFLIHKAGVKKVR